jgi:menaquinone-dependent protoporphyrinogen oxidase
MAVLVVYASRHGATEGIAARIASRLAASGAPVDLRRVDQVEALGQYGAVVFGAPVYDQAWPPEADGFVARHRDALAARPLWLFSVGSFGDTKRVIGPLTRKEPKNISQTLATLHPREYRVFQGVIQKNQWPFWPRMFFHAFGRRFGDHREWPVIDAWADHVALRLINTQHPTTKPYRIRFGHLGVKPPPPQSTRLDGVVAAVRRGHSERVGRRRRRRPRRMVPGSGRK